MGGSAAAQCGRSHARRKDEWRERVGAGVGFAAAAVGRLWRQHYLAVAKPGSAWLSPQQREQVAAEAAAAYKAVLLPQQQQPLPALLVRAGSVCRCSRCSRCSRCRRSRRESFGNLVR